MHFQSRPEDLSRIEEDIVCSSAHPQEATEIIKEMTNCKVCGTRCLFSYWTASWIRISPSQSIGWQDSNPARKQASSATGLTHNLLISFIVIK